MTDRDIKPENYSVMDPTGRYVTPDLRTLESALLDGPALPIRWTWDEPGVLHLKDANGRRLTTLADGDAMLFIHAANVLPAHLAYIEELKSELSSLRADLECVSSIVRGRVARCPIPPSPRTSAP